jgi:hypothetical protein
MLIDAKNEEELMESSYGQYLPFTFEEMLQYMHKLSHRNHIISLISDPMSSQKRTREEIMKDVVNYVRLFKAYKHLVSDSANEPPTFIKVAKEKTKAKSKQRPPLKSFGLNIDDSNPKFFNNA